MQSLQDLYDSTNEVHLVCLLADAKNMCFKEALQNKKGKSATDEEIRAVDHNNTWEVVKFPKESQPFGVKWIFKKKMNAQCEIE